MVTNAAELAAHGRTALADGRWSDAAQAFDSAMELEARPDTAFGLAVAHWWLAETDRALRGWESAYVLYRRTGDVGGAVMAAFYLCLAYQMSLGNQAAARGWLARAARAAAGHGGAGTEGWIALARAHLAIDDGQPRMGEQFAREATASAAALSDIDLELCATSELGAALIEQGRNHEGGALLDEAMAGALAGEARDRDAVVLISCRTITASSRAGDLRRVMQWVAAADDFHRRYGSPHLFATCRTQYGAILFATGQWAEAEKELAAALQIGRGAEEAVRVEVVATLAELRIAQGRLDEARRLLDGYEGHSAAVVSLALIHLATGEPKIAAAVVRRRIRQVDPTSIGAARLLDVLVRAELEAAAIAAAEDAASSLAAAAAATGSEVVGARARRAAGRLALVGGDHAVAADLFEHAAEAFQRADLPLESARARLLLAEAVLATPARAIAEARDALAAFDRLGAVRDADATSAFLRALGIRAGRAVSTAAGTLTRREREVLALLGGGLSNSQIADRLFITRKTVEHHVASVLAKAGLSGRTEAAAWAVRHLDGQGTDQQGRK